MSNETYFMLGVACGLGIAGGIVFVIIANAASVH